VPGRFARPTSDEEDRAAASIPLKDNNRVRVEKGGETRSFLLSIVCSRAYRRWASLVGWSDCCVEYGPALWFWYIRTAVPTSVVGVAWD
jgi:hypothetical protein